MKKYEAVIFDLFDTLINFNRSTLPLISFEGTDTPSTSLAVYEVFKQSRDMDFDEFYRFFIESYDQFQNLKKEQHKEYSSSERFKLMLENMDIQDDSKSDGFVEDMVQAHMSGLAGTMEFPEEHRETLKSLERKGYRMAVISNFDHAPTARRLLRKHGIRKFFEEVVISEDIGWRKPRIEIFERAFELLVIEPEEAIFVGNDFDADVVGAKRAGMDVVWIDRNDETLGNKELKPDYIVSELVEIENVL